MLLEFAMNSLLVLRKRWRELVDKDRVPLKHCVGGMLLVFVSMAVGATRVDLNHLFGSI